MQRFRPGLLLPLLGALALTTATACGDDYADAAVCNDERTPEPAPLTGITAEHNKIRCAVRPPNDEPLPPLTWSPSLAAVAQAYADQLASQGCTMVHSGGPYGENLYWSMGMSPTPAMVVGAWADEISCFTYGAIPDCCSCTCGHYTQIVWRDSLEVGCGMATCGSEQIWVCNYDPPGNWIGQPPY